MGKQAIRTDVQFEITPIQLAHSTGGPQLYLFARVFAFCFGRTRKQQDATKYNKYYKNSNTINSE